MSDRLDKVLSKMVALLPHCSSEKERAEAKQLIDLCHNLKQIIGDMPESAITPETEAAILVIEKLYNEHAVN